ncbi:MAG: hypothetical protein ACR2PA_19085, partial [Hyphomicrobiaceae bacterium]
MAQLSGTGSEGSSSNWPNIVRAIAILIPVVAAIPTVFDLYTAIREDIPFWEVRWRLKQGELSRRNWDCQPQMQYAKLANLKAGESDKSLIFASACPKSGDTHVRLHRSTTTGPSQLWISYNELSAQRRGFRWVDIVFGSSSANAAEPAKTMGSSRLRMAQAASFEVMCTALASRDKIIQVVKEGGQCFKEEVSPYGGKVGKREPVACTTKCDTLV